MAGLQRVGGWFGWPTRSGERVYPPRLGAVTGWSNWPTPPSEHVYQRHAGDGLTGYMGKHADCPPGWYTMRPDASIGRHRKPSPYLANKAYVESTN
jgi:hypothetical protein